MPPHLYSFSFLSRLYVSAGKHTHTSVCSAWRSDEGVGSLVRMSVGGQAVLWVLGTKLWYSWLCSNLNFLVISPAHAQLGVQSRTPYMPNRYSTNWTTLPPSILLSEDPGLAIAEWSLWTVLHHQTYFKIYINTFEFHMKFVKFLFSVLLQFGFIDPRKSLMLIPPVENKTTITIFWAEFEANIFKFLTRTMATGQVHIQDSQRMVTH